MFEYNLQKNQVFFSLQLLIILITEFNFHFMLGQREYRQDTVKNNKSFFTIYAHFSLCLEKNGLFDSPLILVDLLIKLTSVIVESTFLIYLVRLMANVL